MIVSMRKRTRFSLTNCNPLWTYPCFHKHDFWTLLFAHNRFRHAGKPYLWIMNWSSKTGRISRLLRGYRKKICNNLTNSKNPCGFFSWFGSDGLNKSGDFDESSHGSGLAILTKSNKPYGFFSWFGSDDPHKFEELRSSLGSVISVFKIPMSTS